MIEQKQHDQLRLLSVCTGIGGADLAAQWTGAIEIAGQIEIDPFCCQVLEKHWPHVKRMGDIREVRGDEFGCIDIAVAGFPCQPHSLAGKRQGSQDERNLWPEVYRLLSTIQPRWFLGENVPGLLSVEDGRFYGSILADLGALGYRVGWAIYGAGEVGAPHRRERIFLVAYLPFFNGSRAWRPQPEGQQWTPHADLACVSPVEDTASARCQEQPDTAGIYHRSHTPGQSALADSDSHRRRDRQEQPQCQSTCSGTSDARANGTQGTLADPDIRQREWSAQFQARREQLSGERNVRSTINRCSEGVANTAGGRERQHCCTGSEEGAQPLTLQSGAGAAQPTMGRMSHGLSAWLDTTRWPALPGREQHAWEPVRIVTERVPDRAKRLKALGNAIVPHQIYPFFQFIVAYERGRI